MWIQPVRAREDPRHREADEDGAEVFVDRFEAVGEVGPLPLDGVDARFDLVLQVARLPMNRSSPHVDGVTTWVVRAIRR